MAIYMKFGSIAGQVETDGYKDWIELYSFQYGVGRGVSSGAGGSQREGSNPSISEITVTKNYDKSSPGLYQDALNGEFKSKVEIKFTVTQNKKVDTYLAFELTDCGISGYSMSSGGDNPNESLSLNFSKIMVAPTTPDTRGGLKAGSKVTYDLLKLTTS